MSVEVKKIGSKYRLVQEGKRAIERTEYGVARDGGGHKSKAKALRQAGYINDYLKDTNNVK